MRTSQLYKKINFPLVVFIGCLTLVLSFSKMLPFHILDQENQFKHNSLALLRSSLILKEAAKLTIDSKTGLLNVRQFQDGSWVAIIWHSMHSSDVGDQEWDGACLRDSKGDEYWSEHHFCGAEGFASEFMNTKASTLEEFYKQAVFANTLTPTSGGK